MTRDAAPLRLVARPLDERLIRTPAGGEDPLSPLDRDLIRLLQRDGRRSFAQMARELGVTEKTVRRHVERLRETGIIDITTVADPRLLGYGSSALVGLTVGAGADATAVAAQLAALDAVDYVVVSTGRFHVMAEVLGRDMAELTATIEEQVRRSPGVLACETFPYLRLYYQQPEWHAAHERDPAGVRGGTHAVIDDIDRRILAELNADGRVPLGQVAAAVGMSESVVRERVSRLTASGRVKIMALTNPLSLGFELIAWLGVVAAPGVKLTVLADELAARGAIAYLAICAGRFDILCEVICTDEEELLALLDDEVRSLPGIARVEVSLSTELHYKRLQPRF
jgi:Lrp/AsnC family transcriptional regulator for asnA, asnC and gidA